MKQLKKAKGILLDIGLTSETQPNFIKMGKGKSNAIVHDLEKFPWPLESNSCLIVLAAHIIEHIKPCFRNSATARFRASATRKPRGEY